MGSGQVTGPRHGRRGRPRAGCGGASRTSSRRTAGATHRCKRRSAGHGARTPMRDVARSHSVALMVPGSCGPTRRRHSVRRTSAPRPSPACPCSTCDTPNMMHRCDTALLRGSIVARAAPTAAAPPPARAAPSLAAPARPAPPSFLGRAAGGGGPLAPPPAAHSRPPPPPARSHPPRRRRRTRRATRARPPARRCRAGPAAAACGAAPARERRVPS